MKKLLATLISAAFLAVPLALVTAPASAATKTQAKTQAKFGTGKRQIFINFTSHGRTARHTGNPKWSTHNL